MKIHLFSAAVLAFASSAAYGQSQAVQWRVEDGGNGHWYQWVPYGSFTSWTEVSGEANQKGAHLATVTSAAEEAFVRSLFEGGSCSVCPGSSIFVGGYQDPTSPEYSEPAGGWRWVTGEPWSYTNWVPAEPNDQGADEDYLCLRCPEGWNDASSGATCAIAAMIEWSADCNGDGIVDYGQILAGQLSDANSDGVPDTCTTQPCDGAFLDDDFTAPSLDTSRWTTKLPYSCSSLQLGNGEALLQGRAQILTVSDFPATGGGFRLEFGFRYVSGSELFAVSLLTSGDTSGTCCAQVNNGLSLYWHSFNSPSTIVLLDPGQFTSTNFVRTGSLTVQAGDVFLVEIEVTDSRVEAVYRKASDSTQVMTLGWDWSGTPLGNKIAFFNREFCSTRTALLYARVYRLLDPTGDIDGDGILNCSDNCPSSANPAQEDCNGNGVGDACDLFADCDGDGVSDDCEILSGDATDFDSNSVPDSCECLADLSDNGVVNGVDLAAVLSSWGTNGQSELNADINRDGIVNGQDLAFVLGAWGPCP